MKQGKRKRIEAKEEREEREVKESSRVETVRKAKEIALNEEITKTDENDELQFFDEKHFLDMNFNRINQLKEKRLQMTQMTKQLVQTQTDNESIADDETDWRNKSL